MKTVGLLAGKDTVKGWLYEQRLEQQDIGGATDDGWEASIVPEHH